MNTHIGHRPELRCERDGAVAVLELDRPAVRNALGGAVVARLGDTLTGLGRDSRVRAVVLTGRPPGFSAGSDLRELASLSPSAMVRHEARTGAVVRGIRRLGVPVLAAVEGFAVGGGFLLAAGCDLVVTAADARWRLPEVRLGWVPPWGLHGLVERVGPAAAKRLVWDDAPIGGEEAGCLGIADEVCAPGTALDRARELAGRLAELPPHAVVSAKRALTLAGSLDDRRLDERSTRMFGRDCQTAAARQSLFAYGPAGGSASPAPHGGAGR